MLLGGVAGVIVRAVMRGTCGIELDAGRLGAAVRLSGGIRFVSRAAGVDASNLSRCLSGAGGLSEGGLSRVAAALGRPGGRADRSRVLALRAKRPDEDVVECLQWLFPGGAAVARAAWSAMTAARLKKFLRGDLTPEIYAFTDGEARATLRFPAGPMLPRGLYPERMPGLRWWEDDPDRAVLDVDDPVRWATGNITPVEFDEAWPGRGYDPSADDLLDTVRDLRISYAEAIRRLHRGQHKP